MIIQRNLVEKIIFEERKRLEVNWDFENFLKSQFILRSPNSHLQEKAFKLFFINVFFMKDTYLYCLETAFKALFVGVVFFYLFVLL